MSLKVKEKNPITILDELISEVTEFSSWEEADEEARYYVQQMMQGEVYNQGNNTAWLEILADKRFQMKFYNQIIIWHNESFIHQFEFTYNVYKNPYRHEVIVYEKDGNEFVIEAKKDDIFMKAICLVWIRYGLFVI